MKSYLRYLAVVNEWKDIYVDEGLHGVVNFYFVEDPVTPNLVHELQTFATLNVFLDHTAKIPMDKVQSFANFVQDVDLYCFGGCVDAVKDEINKMDTMFSGTMNTFWMAEDKSARQMGFTLGDRLNPNWGKTITSECTAVPQVNFTMIPCKLKNIYHFCPFFKGRLITPPPTTPGVEPPPLI